MAWAQAVCPSGTRPLATMKGWLVPTGPDFGTVAWRLAARTNCAVGGGCPVGRPALITQALTVTSYTSTEWRTPSGSCAAGGGDTG